MSKRIDKWLNELVDLKTNIETNILVSETTLKELHVRLYEVNKDIETLMGVTKGTLK